MLKRLAQAVLGLSLAALPSMAAVVTFDGIGQPSGAAAFAGNPADASFDGPLLILGIEITGDDNTSFLATNNAVSPLPPLGGNYLQVNTAGDDPSNPSLVVIGFDRGNDNSTWAIGNSFSIDLQDTEQNVVLGAYDPAGNLLAIASFSVVSGTFTFPTLTALDRIDSIHITDVGGDGYLVDNITFELDGEASEVPEPSTLALMGAGLAAVAFLRRRR